MVEAEKFRQGEKAAHMVAHGVALISVPTPYYKILKTYEYIDRTAQSPKKGSGNGAPST